MSLSRAQWSLAEQLFEQALQLAPRKRPAFLTKACAGDTQLREEVTALLAAISRADDFLSAPVAVIATESAEPQYLPVGTVLGPWRILDLLGHGGMGEVYNAERADGAYEQQVALKILKRGLDTAVVLRRFLQERRILARLTHPNISRLLDAGSAQDGRPYLAMERVHGKPITAWCRERAVSLRQIIELACETCAAVSAAHRLSIVHRDLKPSNVLVSEDGEIKLLDFGIAKLLDEEGGEETQTHLGAPVTPQYAAPEQLVGLPVTPATDVYALGSLLYEMLTGVAARPSTNAAAAVAAVSLHENAVTRPSRAVLRDPCRARELEGDLDLILLKALAVEPERRYPSAAGLEEDLRRYLEGRPVLARPDSWTYRAGKFVRRNRLSTTFAGLALVALIAGFTASLWQAHAAQREARRANAVRDFIENLFEPIRGGLVKNKEPSLRDLLANGVERLDQTPTLGATERVDLLLMFARLTEQLGDREKALVLAERAYGLADKELGTKHQLTFDALVARGMITLHRDDLKQALPLLQMADRRSRTGDYSGMPLIRLHDGLSSMAAAHGRSEEALHYARLALQERLAIFEPDSLKVSTGYNNFGVGLSETADYEAAADAFRRSHAIDLKHLAPDAFEVGVPLRNLGTAEMYGGHLRQGRQTLLKAQAIFTKAQGEPRPPMVYTLHGLCTVEMAIAPIHAKDRCAEALSITERAFGKDSSPYGRMLRLAGLLQIDLGNLTAAAEALTQSARLVATNDVQSVRARTDIALGELHLVSKRPDAAAALLSAATERYGTGFPAYIRQHGLALLALACHSGASQGCSDQAFKRADAEITAARYRWSPFLLPAHTALARVELMNRQPAAASKRLRAAIAKAKGEMDPAQPRLVDAQLWLAIAAAQSGNCAAASAFVRPVLRIIQEQQLTSHPILEPALAELGKPFQKNLLSPGGICRALATK
jgi:eukaryotic-like serine/threonine-protein kinase